MEEREETDEDVVVRFRVRLGPEGSLSDSSDSNEDGLGEALPSAMDTLL